MHTDIFFLLSLLCYARYVHHALAAIATVHIFTGRILVTGNQGRRRWKIGAEEGEYLMANTPGETSAWSMIRAAGHARECAHQKMHFHLPSSDTVQSDILNFSSSVAITETCGTDGGETRMNFDLETAYFPASAMPGFLYPLQTKVHPPSPVTWLKLIKFAGQLQTDLLSLCSTKLSVLSFLPHQFAGPIANKLQTLQSFLEAHCGEFSNNCCLPKCVSDELKLSKALTFPKASKISKRPSQLEVATEVYLPPTSTAPPKALSRRELSRIGSKMARQRQMKTENSIGLFLLWWTPSACPFFHLVNRSGLSLENMLRELCARQISQQSLPPSDDRIYLFYATTTQAKAQRASVTHDMKTKTLGYRVLSRTRVAHIQRRLLELSLSLSFCDNILLSTPERPQEEREVSREALQQVRI